MDADELITAKEIEEMFNLCNSAVRKRVREKQLIRVATRPGKLGGWSALYSKTQALQVFADAKPHAKGWTKPKPVVVVEQLPDKEYSAEQLAAFMTDGMEAFKTDPLYIVKIADGYYEMIQEIEEEKALLAEFNNQLLETSTA